MSAYAVLREKPIRVESFGIRKVFWSPVQAVRQYRNVSASRNDVITCWNKEHTADNTACTREFSHWTPGTIKLSYVADETYSIFDFAQWIRHHEASAGSVCCRSAVNIMSQKTVVFVPIRKRNTQKMRQLWITHKALLSFRYVRPSKCEQSRGIQGDCSFIENFGPGQSSEWPVGTCGPAESALWPVRT